ncbi:hypothetical protein CPB84DRAFT_1499313 [Gymnopilus junonius]|uniref:Uncharacterized protein n=1 Tax=Gymnopilus junonius TaxID=109634 RepID=A0A9P5TTA4_GYMJU|nr:hypothetical protein CPB84DRAFT_1499313 [Gymnopilus junonius]
MLKVLFPGVFFRSDCVSSLKLATLPNCHDSLTACVHSSLHYGTTTCLPNCLRTVMPPTTRQLLVRFHREILVQHPYISAAVLLIWSFYPQFPFHLLYFIFYVVPCSIFLGILTCLGFEPEGVRSDSLASRYQSRYYGGYTPRYSIFSRSQSYGAINSEPFAQQRPVRRKID